MGKLRILAAALLCISACTKTSEPEYVLGPDDIVVTVKDSERGTKTVLSENTKTKFASGDLIRVYDTDDNTAIYKYRTRSANGDVFQKYYAAAGFNKSNFASAFYPYEKLDTVNSTKEKFVAVFKDSTTFVENSFPKGAAPMVSFTMTDSKIVFSNCFAVLGVDIKYGSVPEVALKVRSVKLESTSSYLNGKFEFTSSAVTYKSDGNKTMTLTGCDAAGALDTTAKRFYLAVPGITSASENMTVTVKPTTDVPFSGKFIAKNSGSSSVLAKNYILNLNPFVLNPVAPGDSSTSSYSVDDWIKVDTIKVGQITVAKSEVSVKKGKSFDVQINGVSDWNQVNVARTKGTDSNFTFAKKEVAGTPTKYYITITGGTETTTNGEIYINDTVTNSGSYIYVTVTE